jgi:hypothetical protein
MEPLVQTFICPNCSEAHIHFAGSATTSCDGCGFQIGAYNDKRLAAEHFTGFRRDPDVIVADPVQVGARRWLIAHTRMMLV